MCDATKILEYLRERQVKPEPLCCTASSNCWCNQLSYRFPLEQMYEICLSPKEMLEQAGHDMNSEDIKYLRSLIHKEFIP